MKAYAAIRASLTMRALLMVAFVFCALRGFTGVAGAADYEELVALAKQGNINIDYTTLRDAYARSSSYDPYTGGTAQLRRPFEQAFAAGDCDSAVKQGQAILEKNFVSIDTHLVLGTCHGRLGQTDRAEHHTAMARGLIQSILATGDGKTPQTAFSVISVAEEYSLLRVLGARKVQQALVDNDGHSYDLITVQTRSGATAEVYFNVDRVMSWAAKEFGPRK
jgi:hypothetical protein